MNRLDEFAARYAFVLDPFQRDAIEALIGGRSVLVAAPTGAGKTMVGEFAVWDALRGGAKCFYTTPIKALSNQKYSDLVAVHGAAQVGLLTGDNAINGEAPIVVMTTEVLRNMLYEASPTLAGLSYVVLDEVHYLGDRERGAVWEEVIIQLPASVQLACLSATVSNAEEFGGWLADVRDGCEVVITEQRPVPLDHHYAVGERLYPMFAKARPNPEILVLERQASQRNRPTRRGHRVGGMRLRPPRRSDLARMLAQRNWLPAIYFIFSRAGCDDAVGHLMTDGLVLTTPEERARIRNLVDTHTADLDSADLEVLGYGPWAAALEHGIAAHHAGMVPAFKETVEALFVQGLIKVVFATETLALGINMPARTVVIERLEKWTGASHELLTPGQFTQLTGRAGRRGLDPVGHAVVAYQRDVAFPQVAQLVGRRIEPLISRFAPTYNMAVNLLAHHTRAQAEALLEQSFAQYQADSQASGHAHELARNREAQRGYAERLTSRVGDFREYWNLRRELSRLESLGAKDRRQRRALLVEAAIDALRPGDVIALDTNRRRGTLAAVVSRSVSKSGAPLAGVVTDDRRYERIGPREFTRPPEPIGWLRLPDGAPRQPGFRREVARALQRVDLTQPDAAPKVDTDPQTAARIADLREAVRAHPVHHDPDREEIEVWARRHDDLEARSDQLARTISRRTGSLVRRFDATVQLLRSYGYLDDRPSPTAAGRMLAGLYSDADLVLAECLRIGLLDDLTAGELAAALSLFTYDSRALQPRETPIPTAALAAFVDAATAVWERVVASEAQHDLQPSRPLDAAFADVAWRWASGADLADALGTREITAGDFVRATRQVADLARQVRDVAGPAVAATARAANKALVRGVVAQAGP